MAGNAQYDTPPIPIDLAPVLLAGRIGRDGSIQLMPNLQPLGDVWHDDLTPPDARYRFIFDDLQPTGYQFPTRWHECFGPSAVPGDYLVQNDDRIALYQFLPDGTVKILHDGFVRIPQADVGESVEHVTFTVQGTPMTCYHLPLRGAIIRDGSANNTVPDPSNDDPQADGQYGVELPIRFNPDGRPNKTADDADAVLANSGRHCPVFVDPAIVRDPEIRAWWSVADAAIYTIETGNVDEDGIPDPYVNPPDYALLHLLLCDYRPNVPDGGVDPTDPGSFTREPILCHDIDITGDAWPDALMKIISPYDFGARWQLDMDDNGLPYWGLILFRRDASGEARVFDQPKPGMPIDPATFDVTTLTFQYDLAAIRNAWVVATDPWEYEVSCILAPLFPIEAGDADPTNRGGFSIKNPLLFGSGNNAIKYRLFGLGEAGDEFWSFDEGGLAVKAFDWRLVFQPGAQSSDPRFYARRRRPAKGTHVFSNDAKGNPLPAMLEISTNYTGAAPALNDATYSTAEWRVVGSGSWRLRDDLFGIEIADDDPWNWAIGKVPATAVTPTTPFPAGKVDIVKCLAAPDDQNKRFWLRLTAIVESDFGLQAVAKRRPASPTAFAVVARDLCRDRFVGRVVDASSRNNTPGDPGTGRRQVIVRNDYQFAQAHVEGRRRAHEFAPIPASATVPYLSHVYEIGDRIVGAAGRNVEFNTLMDENNGELPRYPVIVQRQRDFDPEFRTTFLLEDRRADPALRPNYNIAASKKDARRRNALAAIDKQQRGLDAIVAQGQASVRAARAATYEANSAATRGQDVQGAGFTGPPPSGE